MYCIHDIKSGKLAYFYITFAVGLKKSTSCLSRCSLPARCVSCSVIRLSQIITTNSSFASPTAKPRQNIPIDLICGPNIRYINHIFELFHPWELLTRHALTFSSITAMSTGSTFCVLLRGYRDVSQVSSERIDF